MDTFLQQFEHLKIPLEEITSATNNFNDENCIGGGGFGKVYKGEVSHSKGRSLVAIKRLDPTHGQGMPEFNKEITMLSDYKHENLISLLGFCCEGREMILVYEHASRGSLDHHLNSSHLTWTQRLQICLDAAKGLSYLHDPRETHQRLIHCDMKSGNILLDALWKAKVSDFGLAIMGPANEQHSVIVTNAAGTPGYCDPQYAMTHTLTKESDVYSFGVVLFEVLCGRLCCTYRNGRVQQILVPTWIKSYEQKNLNNIIFQNPAIQPLCLSSLETFSDIAYRCLNASRKDRPTMAEVVTALETALCCQEFSKWIPLFDYEKMIESAEPPLNYRCNGELGKFLSKGVLLNGGNTWFSLNKKGQHCEMISFAKCLNSGPREFRSSPRMPECNSRFLVGTYSYNRGFAVNTYPYRRSNIVTHTDEYLGCIPCSLIAYAGNLVSKLVPLKKVSRQSDDCILKTRVKTQFLSPGVTYTVNLVFSFVYPYGRSFYDFFIKYKLQGETKTSISYLASKREDGWWMCELYQFTSDQRIVDLEILFEGFTDFHHEVIHVEGIEFCPLEKVEHKDEKHLILDLDANWEEKLPTNYEDIIALSTDSVIWTTKKEAYLILRKGFLISDGQKWFFLDKNGKYLHKVSARVAGICGEKKLYDDDNHPVDTCDEEHFVDHMLSLPESSFGEAVELGYSWYFTINIDLQSQLVSSETTYASYLVYKLPKGQYRFEFDLVVNCIDLKYMRWHIFLISPQTPEAIKLKADHKPQTRPKVAFPNQRDDGWMEVQIWGFETGTTTTTIKKDLKISTWATKSLYGLLIHGIEFRPI